MLLFVVFVVFVVGVVFVVCGVLIGCWNGGGLRAIIGIVVIAGNPGQILVWHSPDAFHLKVVLDSVDFGEIDPRDRM